MTQVSAERLAQLFYHYWAAFEQDSEGRVPGPTPSWEELPEVYKSRMVKAADLALLETKDEAESDTKGYFAEPGQAEWGP